MPRKVRGRNTSPEGRAVLHQTVDESFVCGQKLRWVEEGLCTTEASHSATGFGSQVGDVAGGVGVLNGPIRETLGACKI